MADRVTIRSRLFFWRRVHVRMIPRCWAEVRAAQALSLAKVLIQPKRADQYSDDEALQMLLGILQLPLYVSMQLRPSDVALLLHCGSALSVLQAADIHLLAQPVPRWRDYAAIPVKDISIDMYAVAQGSLQRYLRGDDTAGLDQLFSTLYKNTRGGEVKASAVPEHIKQGAALWFIGFMCDMERRYPKVFKEEGSAGGAGGGWLPVILASSGQKFGTFEQTADTAALVFFLNLSEQIKSIKSIK